MIEQLKAASAQLRVAWDNYLRVCSAMKDYDTLSKALHNFPLELSRQLDSELAFIPSYESNIQQVKAIIGRARNCSHDLVPINSLPLEVLTRIFHFVPPQDCGLHQLTEKAKEHFPRCPDNLAQVCSLWRKTAHSSRSLWTHIDVSGHGSFWHGLLARAESHVARAGSLPIELHITDKGSTAFPHSYQTLYEFLARISSRVAALVFVATSDFEDFHRGVFLQLFRSIPAILTKLVVRSETSHADASILPGRPVLDLQEILSNSGSRDLYIDLAPEQLEKVFAPMKFLHLRGIFPEWSSQAYHGLVDLRLTSTEDYTSRVEETMLIAILESSPMLSILHFGLTILRPTPEDGHVTPVHLRDLQALKIFMYFDTWTLEPTVQIGSVLRLLAPGTKPLCLSIHNEPKHNPFTAQQIELFFERSKVTRFYNYGALSPTAALLRHASQLEVMVLDSCYSGSPCPNPFKFDESMASGSLKSVYIGGSIHAGTLRLMVGLCSAGIVLYNNCRAYISLNEEFRSIRNLSEIELRKMFPTVKITRHKYFQWPDPTSEWDLLD